MSNIYFHCRKEQRKASLIILMNAVLLFIMYLAAVKYLPEVASKEAAQENIDVLNIVIWPIELILIALAVYFWRKNKAFVMMVTDEEFYYIDPTFSTVEYRIPITDIKALTQFTDTQQTGLTNRLKLKNGDFVNLMYHNFHIDRRAFFDALKKANPNIDVPESVYRYKVTRPNWAKRLLGKSD